MVLGCFRGGEILFIIFIGIQSLRALMAIVRIEEEQRKRGRAGGVFFHGADSDIKFWKVVRAVSPA